MFPAARSRRGRLSLPAIAKWLDASASVRRPVSGDSATTANFALVVSGVPTSGENTNISGACGSSGSTRAGQYLCMSHVPKAGPADVRAQHRLLDPRRLGRPRAQVHEQRLPKYPPDRHTTMLAGVLPRVRDHERERVPRRPAADSGSRVILSPLSAATMCSSSARSTAAAAAPSDHARTVCRRVADLVASGPNRST